MATNPRINWFAVDTAMRVTAPMAFEVVAFENRRNIPNIPGARPEEHAEALRQMAPIADRKARGLGRAQMTATAAHGAAERYFSNTAAYESVNDAVQALRAAGTANVYSAVQGASAAGNLASHASGLDQDRGYSTWKRVFDLGEVRASWFVRMLDIDVHSTAELETALVATDFVLERGGSYDDRLRMQTLQHLRPVITYIESGWPGVTIPPGLDSRFRKPVWAVLPGAGAAHPDWSTFMAWPQAGRSLQTLQVAAWIDWLVAGIAVTMPAPKAS